MQDEDEDKDEVSADRLVSKHTDSPAGGREDCLLSQFRTGSRPGQQNVPFPVNEMNQVVCEGQKDTFVGGCVLCVQPSCPDAAWAAGGPMEGVAGR